MNEPQPLPNDPATRTAEGTMIPPTPPTEQTTQTTETEKKPEGTEQPAKTSEGSEKKETLLGEKKPEEKKPEAAAGAPEKYEAYKLPEGVTLTEESLTAANTIFKELNLSQAQAQQLVDFHVKQIQTAEDAPTNAWVDQQNTWRKEVADDATLGPRMNEIKQNYENMLNSVNDPALVKSFKEMVEFTGAGNNPSFLRMIDKLAKPFASPTPVKPGSPVLVAEPGKAQGPGASAMYPNLR